jgi:hypothetical protein
MILGGTLPDAYANSFGAPLLPVSAATLTPAAADGGRPTVADAPRRAICELLVSVSQRGVHAETAAKNAADSSSGSSSPGGK